ncbi:MAG: Rieske 2Fe-2S domain-containing protein [Acidimicrobiia bacterium]|nr:Rieske 2Fe-2S domain-containing protein [Acidimicrobiia bacterium]
MDDHRVELGDTGDLGDGQLRYCDIGDHGVVVCRVKGEVFALEDNCSHADTPLSQGSLSGYMLTCPLHGAQFDVRDGSHGGPPAYVGVRTYPVEESETGVVIDMSAPDVDPDDGFGQPGGMFRTR